MTHTQDDYLVDAILCNQTLAETKEALASANDTIRIALDIAGYDVSSMNQFERASALLNMAQEYRTLTDKCEKENRALRLAGYNVDALSPFQRTQGLLGIAHNKEITKGQSMKE